MSTIFNFDTQQILDIILEFIENSEKEVNKYIKKTGFNKKESIRKSLRIIFYNEIMQYLKFRH